MARGVVLFVLALAIPRGMAIAQNLRIPEAVGEVKMVAKAEAEGAAFPRLPQPRHVPRSFSTRADPLSGTSLAVLGRGASTGHENEGAVRQCVVGHDIGPVRSGEFVIGGNLGGAEAMTSGRIGKVWWVPLHQGAEMPPLVVRGRSLTTPSDTMRFTTSTVAESGRDRGPLPADVPREFFFPSGITIPQAGRWLLLATSGANWGCFLLTVR
jgi:hypothetical protein